MLNRSEDMHDNMIETKRLYIKPLTAEELRKHVEEPEAFARELGLAPSQSLMEEEAKEAVLNDLLPNIINPSNNPLFYTMWLVIGKAEKAIIGGICFHGAPDEQGEVEIGYGTDEGYRNRGYMTETIAGMMEWLREKKIVRKVRAETAVDNIPSLKVLGKNGFRVVRQNENTVILLVELE
ncbi:MAG TPA: GNAT family N-acetyltransferase [Bacteroidales bacterium]|nr:GNAT family N-acetyltransferase [Bacteroidales bacterium]